MEATMISQIGTLEREILDIGEMVELAISRSISCLVRRDIALARCIIKEDQLIDCAEVTVQENCVTILEHDRPSGKDLRFVVAILKINDSLERIGDLAENVAETVVKIGNWERFLQVGGIEDMATVAQRMVRDSLKALVSATRIWPATSSRLMIMSMQHKKKFDRASNQSIGFRKMHRPC